MTSINQTQFSRSRRDILLLVVLCLFVFCYGLGSRSLFSKDAVRYAEIAREMIHFDTWLVPRFNGDIYAKKPAPYLWLIAGPSALIGEVNEWTARLPSAIAGLGAVVFTYLLGRAISGRRAGMYSAVCLVSCYKFNLLARTSRTDMPFAFFVIASIYFLYAGMMDTSRRGRNYILAFVMAAFSVFMKGPAGIIIVLLTALAYAIFRRDWALLKSRSLLWGFLIFLAIIAIWLVPTCIVGGREFSRNLLVEQNLGRFSGGIDHVEPLYYYFYKLPLEITPLNLLIPLVIVFYLSKTMERDRCDVGYLIVFFVVTFLFFQMSRSRNIRYLLPLFPAVAIFFGIFWDDFIYSASGMSKSMKRIFTIIAIIVIVFSLAVAMGMPWYLYGKASIGVGLLAVLLIVALYFSLERWKENPRLSLFISFSAVAITASVFLITELDVLEQLPVQVVFGKELKDAADGGDLYLYKYYRLEYGHSRPTEFFYYGRYTPALRNMDELDKAISSHVKKPVFLLTLKSIYEDDLVGYLSMEVVLRKKYMGEDVVLVRVLAI